MKYLLLILILLFACTKQEMLNYRCITMEVTFAPNNKCPDTTYHEIYQYNVTKDQYLYWLTTYDTQEKVIHDGDTTIIKKYLLDCGETVCP